MVAVPSTGRATQVTPRRGAPEADATRALYERYARQIFAYCQHQLGGREEAEDAVQSTFLNAFRGLKRGIDPEFESAWLYKIAENVCLTRQRSSSRRRRVESPGDLDAMQDLLPSHQPDRDELIRLPQALEEMPEQQRRALLLREWQGLSYREIAEELDLSQAAVETLLFRARRSLASGLTDEAKPKKVGVAKKLRSGVDAGSLLALLKTLLFSGGAKLAVAVATVAATSVVAATPAVRHTVENVVAPRHLQTAKPHAATAKSAPHAVVWPSRAVASPVATAQHIAGVEHTAPAAHRVRHTTAKTKAKALADSKLELRLGHAPPTLVEGTDAVPAPPVASVPSPPVAAEAATTPAPAAEPAAVPPVAAAAPAPAPANSDFAPSATQPSATPPAAPAPSSPSQPGGAKKDDSTRGDPAPTIVAGPNQSAAQPAASATAPSRDDGRGARQNDRPGRDAARSPRPSPRGNGKSPGNIFVPLPAATTTPVAKPTTTTPPTTAKVTTPAKPATVAPTTTTAASTPPAPTATTSPTTTSTTAAATKPTTTSTTSTKTPPAPGPPAPVVTPPAPAPPAPVVPVAAPTPPPAPAPTDSGGHGDHNGHGFGMGHRK